MSTEIKSLADVAEFLEHEVTYFTGVIARQEWGIFRNYFEGGYKGFKILYESSLTHLIDNIKEKKVNTTMNLKEASQFFAVVDCKFINKEIRSALYDLVYSDFIRNLIDDIQKGKLDELAFEEGAGLMRMIESNMVEESLRLQLRNFVYPRIIESLIDDIQQKRVDELSFVEVRQLVRILRYDLVEENLCVQLQNFVYPRMIKTLINSIQEGVLEVDEISWGDLKGIQVLIDSDVDQEQCSLLCSLFYDGDRRKTWE